MIVVHHLENSRSQRILWLLEELALPYELRLYRRDPETMLAPAALRAVHPLGKSPVISDGERVVAESAVIIEYLLDHYGEGRLRPALATPAYDDYRYWLHFAEGSVMPYLVMKLVFRKVETGPMPFFVRPIARRIAAEVGRQFIDPNVQQIVAYIDVWLQQHRWFAGEELSAADIQMSFVMEALASQEALCAPYPAVQAYVQAMRARPAYQRALQRGGPLDLQR